MFYIGSHSGQLSDGYISSSRWFTGEVLFRPQDFKRRILRIYDTKQDAIREERRLIALIKPTEFRTRYYNTKMGRKKGFTALNKGKPMSIEQRQKISNARKGKPGNTKGKKFPNRTGCNNVMNREEVRQKISEKAKRRRKRSRPDGTKYWIYIEKALVDSVSELNQ